MSQSRSKFERTYNDTDVKKVPEILSWWTESPADSVI